MNQVAVIDYGMGNLHSVAKAIEHVGAELASESGQATKVIITSDPARIAAADRVVFPGVGAIRDCMAEINRLDVGAMVASAMKTKPVLAICVGMQALMAHSEENGGVDCLGLLSGRVKFFGEELRDESDARLKVPHMGWNRVAQTSDHPLWRGVPDNSRFYFVHSYYVTMDETDQVAGRSVYGREIVAAISAGNIFATQFHPEKSQNAGLTLLRNFLTWNGASD
ncbi:MAG: imidazole glycerol phosphate synthase subunit HisH [Pseudohongiellaceae bacterium]